jgi:hypothetical protein
MSVTFDYSVGSNLIVNIDLIFIDGGFCRPEPIKNVMPFVGDVEGP